MVRRFSIAGCFAAAVWILVSNSTEAGDRRFDLGLRANIDAGDGIPANDIIGAGLYGHYQLRDGWFLGFAIDHASGFDVERTAKLLGLEQDPGVDVLDSKADATTFSGWIERAYEKGASGKWELFWTAGVGVSSVDVADISGPLAGGGTFDIATDAGTEFIASAGFGARRWFADSAAFEVAIRADQHFADWSLTDRVSGATSGVSDYLVTGIHFGLLKSF